MRIHAMLLAGAALALGTATALAAQPASPTTAASAATAKTATPATPATPADPATDTAATPATPADPAADSAAAPADAATAKKPAKHTTKSIQPDSADGASVAHPGAHSKPAPKPPK